MNDKVRENSVVSDENKVFLEEIYWIFGGYTSPSEESEEILKRYVELRRQECLSIHDSDEK